VAVGFVDSYVALDSGWDAAVWVSVDGYAWERVADENGALGGPAKQVMYAVVAGGPGLVAVGGDESGDDFDAAVWASVDGLTWERVAHDESIFGGPDRQTMFGLAVVEGLGLVAWGEDFDEPLTKGIWVSPPVAGLEWARVSSDEPYQVCFGCAVLGDLLVRADDTPGMAVVAGGPGLVAVGTDEAGGGQDAAVWTSSDGLTWQQVPHDEAVFGGDGNQEMCDVVAGGPGLIAVGTDRGGDGDAAVWASADGLIWERVSDQESALGGPGDQRMGAVVAGGPGLVAVGQENTTSDSNAVVWISVDGLTWERVPDPESVFGDPDSTYQDMVAVVAGGPGLVAVGSDRSGGDSDAAVWASVDGFAWFRVPHDEAAFGGPGDQGMGAVVVTDSGLAAELWDSESGENVLLVSPPPG